MFWSRKRDTGREAERGIAGNSEVKNANKECSGDSNTDNMQVENMEAGDIKRVYIDAGEIRGMKDIHDIFKESLGFPEYYGDNLDALYDCLSERTDEVEIHIKHIEKLELKLENHFKSFRGMLYDLIFEHPNIKLFIE